MKVLVTGAAGFVGFHLCRRLLAQGAEVFGFDSLSPYYDPRLKHARRALLKASARYVERIGRLEDQGALVGFAQEAAPDVIVHLAAQAGVRHSLEQPRAYLDSNLVGTFEAMEAARRARPRHFLMASTSSAYGANLKSPFCETDKADHPLTFYAATKKAGEEMTHCYAHLHGLPTTMLRFFTVYGPWGRPDMAYFKFAEAAMAGEPIEVYGEGRMARDFTYVDDVIEAIARLIDRPPVVGAPVGPMDSLSPVAPWRVVNIAGGAPVGLIEFIDALEAALRLRIERRYLPMQPGDVVSTHADPALLDALIGYRPTTPVATGVASFADWFRDWRARRDTLAPTA
jgi:UDP-glucuronate 4-epimerase